MGGRTWERRAVNTDEVAEPNVFAAQAAVAAYTEGGPWLDDVRSYIHGNKQIAYDFLTHEITNIRAIRSEVTYLLWIDCSALMYDTEHLVSVIREKTGLYICAGEEYGKAGGGFVRVNIACPRERLCDGLEHLRDGCRAYIQMSERG